MTLCRTRVVQKIAKLAKQYMKLEAQPTQYVVTEACKLQRFLAGFTMCHIFWAPKMMHPPT